MSEALLTAWRGCRAAVDRVAGNRPVTLVAVSKTRPAAQVRALAALGQRDFGENYLQEARLKIDACADLALCWHFIGPLQSNKCRAVAAHFDWLHSLDRPGLVVPLATARPPGLAPLNVLIQVNVEAEPGKAGCAPDQIEGLAASVAAQASLRLRGLMLVPAAQADPERARPAFARLRDLCTALRQRYPDVDTLSMGMSGDFEVAIAEGATMVRIGTAVFGPRPPR